MGNDTKTDLFPTWIKPRPYWDPDYPTIPYCDPRCKWYTNARDLGYGDYSLCGVVKEAMPKLVPHCPECDICMPALALGKEACDHGDESDT